MITANEARQMVTRISSQEQEQPKQKEKTRLTGLLALAIQEEINDKSSHVSRTLDGGSDFHAEIIREILEEKGFQNISVASKYLDHDRYVDVWVEIKFSF